ncbi:MAG TPA: hypothetical protein VJJ02_01905 [Candidatus Paceibacterota bacterium]
MESLAASFEKFKQPEYQQAIRTLCAGQGGHCAVKGLEFQTFENRGAVEIHVSLGHDNPPKFGADLNDPVATIAETAIKAGTSEEDVRIMMQHVEDAVSQLRNK